MQKNHFLLWKKLKNTGSAQLLLLWQVFGISDFLFCTMSNDTTVYNQHVVYYDVIMTNDVRALKGK